MVVTALSCEYRFNPLGIDVLQPRLAWQLRGERRGARQTTYQILVSKSKTGLNEPALLWDTGKVVSDKCTHVPHGGQAPTSGQRLWWQVRIWDEFDRVTAHSAPAWWEMGLLDRSARKADWIGPSIAGGPRTTAPILKARF